MFRFFRSLKSEISCMLSCISRIIIFGAVLLSVALIFIFAADSPIYLSRFGLLRGGTFTVFVCYFSSVLFFFLCGVISALAYESKKAYPYEFGRIILDIIIAYILRVLWIILFFGGFSPLLAVICLTASGVFLVFCLINTVRFSSLMSLILSIMIIFSFVFIIFTLKFISFH